MVDAGEARKIELYGNKEEGEIRRYACADSVYVSKGTLMFLAGDGGVAAKASVVSRALQLPLGIAAHDKEANDGSITIGVWTLGKFDVKASGAIGLGDRVQMAGDNYVIAFTSASVTTTTDLYCGTALETAATAEVIAIKWNTTK